MTNPTSDPTAIRPCPLVERRWLMPGTEANVLSAECPNRRAPKQAEGFTATLHVDYSEDGLVFSPDIRVPESYNGKRVMVSLLDEADGATKGA